jgi:transcriptional regulator with XRE-family HTH domain
VGRRATSAERAERGDRLSAVLRRSRERAGLSQADLASAARVDLDQLRKIERGVIREPGFFTVSDLAQALDIDLGELGRRTRHPRRRRP